MKFVKGTVIGAALGAAAALLLAPRKGKETRKRLQQRAHVAVDSVADQADKASDTLGREAKRLRKEADRKTKQLSKKARRTATEVKKDVTERTQQTISKASKTAKQKLPKRDT